MSKHLFTRAQRVLILLFLLVGGRLNAAEMPFPEAQGQSSDQASDQAKDPILITSDKMVFQNLQDKIIFEGRVVIKKKGLLLESDRAEVFLMRKASSPETQNTKKAQEVSKIIATGHVRIKKGTQHAQSERGVFDRLKEVVILTGKPELWEEGYRIRGKEITFFMNDERTLVTESEVLIQGGSGGFNLPER